MFGRSRAPVLDAAVAGEVIAREVALARDLTPAEHALVVDLALELVSTKRWEGIGVELTDEVLAVLAGNAAIPILGIGTRYYSTVRSIIVEPIGHTATGRFAGPTPGVMRDAGAVAGEAQANSGPVSMAWSQARRDSRFPQRGRNLVIHELAHKIDMVDGYTDGVPPLPLDEVAEWDAMLDRAFDPASAGESDAVMRSYAWTNRAEFFAVATETFFCRPAALRDAKPELYEALAGFYRQDPAARTPSAPDGSAGQA